MYVWAGRLGNYKENMRWIDIKKHVNVNAATMVSIGGWVDLAIIVSIHFFYLFF